MSKNIKTNNQINLNKNFQFPQREKYNPKIKHKNNKLENPKKHSKMALANSVINYKESEIINNKQIFLSKRNSIKNKYYKIETINEKNKINSNKTRELKNNKYNSSNSKENNNILNCFSGRKNSFSKQISFISKLSNEEIRSTIDNENNDIKNNNENKMGNNYQYNTFNNKKNRNNTNKNIYDYQINQLKQILIKKQNIKNNIDKILSNKIKNNNKKNFSGNNTKQSNNLINTNLASFSPIQKNNNLYKISSQSKTNIFSNTNPNINYRNEFNHTNTNSQKSLNNNTKKCINKEKNSIYLTNRFLNKKVTEKSCPLLNINCNSIINTKEPFINEDYLNKNNINIRNISNPHFNNVKGVLKPFCSLINIPINNKEKDENNNKTTNNFNTSNEKNNYYFDKDKYFNEFKNRINLNINNLFFKTKRKKWKNIIENKKNNNENKDIIINNNYNNYSNQKNIYEKNIDDNFGEKMKKLNNLLTEKLSKNEITNEKTIRIKKMKSINLINNTINKKYNKEKDDLFLDDLFIKKRTTRKRSSDNIKSSKINSKNYTKRFHKNSFTSFNRKNINENNKRNYNSFLINVNNTNSKGRNDNIIYNNFFEPQTTIYKKNSVHKNKINNNTNTNSNRNHYIRNNIKKDKSLSISRNKKEKIENKSVITSSRNKNFENNIFNDNTNEKNYLKIIKLFDQITRYKKSKNRKKKDLEICFVNNSNNSANNIDFGNINKKKKEKKQKIKVEVDENKVKENISQNTLTMYTIYILSKYYSNCNKVGLMKIIIFDKNGNNIPVICYNTNSNYNKNQNLTNNTLFNKSSSNKFLVNKNKIQDKPFIMEFKKNLYINFYIKNIKSINIDYIQINNYSNIKESISPVKNIQIFKGNHLIYKGILNEKNEINKIFLNNNHANNKKYSSMISQTNKNINIENIKQRPLSSKRRSCNNILITKNYTYRKSEFNEYYTKRNIFTKSCSSNYIFSDNNYNETNYMGKKSKAFMTNTKKHSASDIRNTKLLTGNLGHELNISNTYTINNITNNPKKTFGNIDKYISHEDLSGNNNRYFEKKLFYNSIKNSNKLDYNLSNNSNPQNKIIKKAEIINEYDSNNRKREGEKIFMKSNSEKKFKKSIIKTQKSLLFKKINEENINDLNINNLIGNTYYNLNNNPINNNGIYKNNIKYNTNKKYIEFNKIRLVLTSNYGHNKYIGLTGIVFYNLKGDPINIETASSIGALPKDLKTILDDNDENRIFENVFNNINNTNEPENMWVTKFKKTPPLSFIEIYFQDRIRLSRIKIFNYNERNKLEIGVKTMDIYLDDQFYKSIFVRQGIGEAVTDFIASNNENNSSNEDFDKYKNYDFGQSIAFPIIDKNINFNYMKFTNNKIKYASFLYEQSYETPFLPCGYYIKFQFCNNYCQYSVNQEFGTLNYNDIGLDYIEIYDQEGKNILDNMNYKNIYTILSNCEINHNEENKIILNGQNENYNNNIFYIFEKEIQISYIKFYPLTKNEKIISFNSLKEIKIFCENNIIFEGSLYIDQPTVVLFTCDSKIIKNINEKYLTRYKKDREFKEIYTEDYISLAIN